MSTRPHQPIFGGMRRRPEEGAVRPLATLPDTACKHCHGHTFERIPRFGFWQEKVLPFFNLYPWRCASCASTLYRANRSIRPAARG